MLFNYEQMTQAYRTPKNAEATARYWGKSLDRPDWYRLKAQDDGDSLEILVYDVIGWPFTDVSQLVRQLAGEYGQVSRITLRINSPGGDVFDGLALFNSLQSHPAQVTTRIEGLAASIASIVALAGSPVTAHRNAMYMIHEPWAIVAGNQHTLRDVADILGKVAGNLLNIYYAKTGAGKKRLQADMEKETWFTAEEAKDRGLIDEVLPDLAAKAAFDLSMYNHPPAGFLGPEGRDLTEREAEKALRDAGASRKYAKIAAAAIKALRDAEAGTGQAVEDPLRDAGDAAVNIAALQLIQSFRGN